MDTPDIIENAADLIATRGWARGDWSAPAADDDAPCALCAVGGLNVAMGYVPDTDWSTCAQWKEAITALAEHLNPGWREDYEEPIFAITGWNDTAGRTRNEVVNELNACAAALRNAA